MVNRAMADLIHWETLFKDVTGGKWAASLPMADGERDMLIGFFEAMLGYGWHDHTGWSGRGGTVKKKAIPAFTLHCNTWKGVAIEDEVLSPEKGNIVGRFQAEQSTDLRGRVVALRLPDNSLDGQLPENLWRLTGLRVLELTGNAVKGRLPANLNLCVWPAAAAAATDTTAAALPLNPPPSLLPPPRCHSATNRYSSLVTLQLGTNCLEGPLPPLNGMLAIEELHLACTWRRRCCCCCCCCCC